MSSLKIKLPHAFRELFTPCRYKVFYGGRGGAKSWAFATALLAIGLQKNVRVLCAREFQASIKDSVHKLLSDVIRAEPRFQQHYEIQETVIKGKNGTEFAFRGLKHNVDGIRSFEGADYVWVEEAQNVSDKSWETLIPTIRKDNSEIWICFNPKSANDPTWQRFVVKNRENAIVRKVSYRDNPFFPKVLDDERLELKRDDPDGYDHVWEGELDIRKSGAVYAKQIAKARSEGRICRVPYDPSSPVFTAWDLGFGDSTAIWWLQFVGRELRWLECYENSGEQLGHYADIIKSKPYSYSYHYLPHDGGHGNIRGDSVSKQLHTLGLKNIVLPRESDITPGIELLRQTIAYSVFDADKCKDGLHALDNYGYEYDEERKVFNGKPKHDWTSHFADAARYAVQAAAQVKSGLIKFEDPYKRERHNAGWMA